VIGLLPESYETDQEAAQVPGWIDLQQTLGTKSSRPSLKALVAKELNKALDKRLQRSDWDRRPLLPDQIQYAALDAAVLLHLRRRWPEATERRSSHENAVTVQTPLSTDQERQKWRLKLHPLRQCVLEDATKNPEEALRSKKAVNGHLRFVLPAAFSKLMRKMRGLGLDTYLMADGSSVPQLAKVALSEDRIVLIQNQKSQLPTDILDRVYWLRSQSVDEQLREVIDVFEIEVDPDCMCGRCVQCNTWDWQFRTADEIRSNPQTAKQVNAPTLEMHSEFWICGGCGKVFWEGIMFEKAVAHFRTFLPDATATPSSLEPSGGTVDCANDAAVKYRDMEARGWSTQRIRAQQVRDGNLAAALSADATGPKAAANFSRAAAASHFRNLFSQHHAAEPDPVLAAAAALREAAGLESLSTT